jgi:hypothetical protein
LDGKQAMNLLSQSLNEYPSPKFISRSKGNRGQLFVDETSFKKHITSKTASERENKFGIKKSYSKTTQTGKADEGREETDKGT